MSIFSGTSSSETVVWPERTYLVEYEENPLVSLLARFIAITAIKMMLNVIYY